MIGDMCANELRELLESSVSLAELYLKWNNLRSEGGVQILQSLRKNQSLKVLDLSFNNIGGNAKKEDSVTFAPALNFSKLLEEVLVTNKKLIHLDISSCGLVEADCVSLQNGLLRNHTLFGLHIQGNNKKGKTGFFIDTNGFVRETKDVKETIIESDTSSASSFSINGVQYRQEKASTRVFARDCCWLCDGWEFVDFKK